MSIQWTLQHASSGSPFFRDLLAGATDDLATVPFTTKEQLREAYPFGWTAVPLEDVVRIHASSGTTGRRTVATYTAGDIEDWTVQFARCLEFAGVTAADRVQIMVGYGLWTAGVGFQAAVERVGAMAIPTGPGNLEMQLEMMRDCGTTVLCATSSFALMIAEEVERRGLRGALDLRVGVFGSERWGEGMRRRIEDLLGISTYDIYGLTELYGPGTGIECAERDGIHYWDDYYVIEIVDTVDLTPVQPGEQGEVVLTTLRKQAMPLVRYRTRDISRLLPGPCRCGSPYPRIARLTGRTDDMIKVRGVSVFPAQVDAALATVDGVASEYQLHVWRDDARERLVVKVETADPSPPPHLHADLADHLRTALGIRPDIELHPPGTLTRSERKTRRVYDHRDE